MSRPGRRDRCGVSRREFLAAAGAASLGSLLTGSRAVAGEKGGAAAASAEGTIPTRKFGRSGIELPVLCHGAAIDNTQNQLLLKQVLRRGVMRWDTAPNYANGKSEEGIGQFFEKNPGTRERIFLVTKSGDHGVAGMEKKLNKSLATLKTDYIDLYFLHGLEEIGPLEIGEIREWVEGKKKEKKIRFFGFSTHKKMASVMTAAAKAGWIDGIMTALNYRIVHDDDMKRAIEACYKAGVGVTAMKTQGAGPINDTKADRKLAGHFVKRGYTPEQAKVKAVLENEMVTDLCSHMDSVEVLESNVAAVQDRTKLDASDWKALELHAAATCGTVCAACGRCEAAVAGGIPVSSVMRYLMYSRGYGDHAKAHENFRRLPEQVRVRLATADFSRAERVCPNGLPIGRLMKEAVLELA